jgi:hypothetical protein
MVNPTLEMTKEKPSNTVALMLVKNSFQTLSLSLFIDCRKSEQQLIDSRLRLPQVRLRMAQLAADQHPNIALHCTWRHSPCA